MGFHQQGAIGLHKFYQLGLFNCLVGFHGHQQEFGGGVIGLVNGKFEDFTREGSRGCIAMAHSRGTPFRVSLRVWLFWVLKGC